jgi:hypothetical protein
MSTLLRRLGSRRGRTYPYAFVHWFLEKLKFSQGEVMVALPLVVDAQGESAEPLVPTRSVSVRALPHMDAFGSQAFVGANYKCSLSAK